MLQYSIRNMQYLDLYSTNLDKLEANIYHKKHFSYEKGSPVDRATVYNLSEQYTKSLTTNVNSS
jgi:hypothetical protein